MSLSIDDFGTGYSSMAYLKHLPVHELKVDRSFVSQMLQSSSDAVIVHSTIDLGCNLCLRVVAEGVENALTSWLEQTATPTPEPVSDSRGPTRIPRQM